MRKFRLVAAQGEITVIRIGDVPHKAKLPNGYSALAKENGKYVIGHSETGHHHVLDRDDALVGVLDRPPEGMRVLRAILENPTLLEHLRPYDTHEPIVLPPGEYEFRIAREFDPYAKLSRLSAD